jgi:hypothetical protein
MLTLLLLLITYLRHTHTSLYLLDKHLLCLALLPGKATSRTAPSVLRLRV